MKIKQTFFFYLLSLVLFDHPKIYTSPSHLLQYLNVIRISLMTSQSIYNEIIPKIKRIYEVYEQRANQMADQKRAKTGAKADKSEDDFLRNMAQLEKNLADLVAQMRKNQKGSPADYREHQMAIEDCLRDISSILKKKSLNFKINPQIRQIVDDTESSLVAIRKDLVIVKETKFLCCGTDGAKKFRAPMNYFKVVAGKWKMLTLFQPKDGIETFVSPKFAEGDYQFIGELLKRKWPESKVIQVQKPVIKEVIKEVVRNTGTKPNRLHDANQLVFGINREENLVEGLNIYHEQADNGNPQACAFLGKVYEEGTLLPMDPKKAMAYYQKGMSGKQAYASYRFALCLISGKFSKSGQSREDIEKAYDILNQISSECPQAMAELGEVHQFGNFQSDVKKLFTVKKDEKKAKAFYTKAKSLNLSRASNNLAVLLLNSKLAQKDGGRSQVTASNELDRTIITLLTQAQEQGFSQAYYNLGLIYSKGLLSQRNSELALKMFYQGSIKGDYKCKIQFAYELMNQTSIMKEEYEDHYHLAIHWLESVVRRLSIDEQSVSTVPSQLIKSERGQALFYLGIFHQHGFGVQKSPKKAISYFIQASECDYAPAKNKIGDCYFSGYGIKQDRQLAVGCYLQAAEMGNSDAMVNLGTVYLNGIPNLVERSYKKAYQYFLNAHQLQNTDAMIHLSYMYRNGLGVQPKESVARDLLEQAAQLRNATALYMLRQQGLQFNQGVLFEHLENQFFSAPKKINMKEIVPVVNSAFRSK